MTGQTAAVAIIELYNKIALHMTARKPVVIRPTPSNLGAAIALRNWLDANGIKPGPFLSACFACHHWAWQPKLRDLQVDRYLRWYRQNIDEVFVWWRNMDREWESAKPVTSTVGSDLVRRRLIDAGGPAFCAMQSSLTGGYAANSPVCATCPQRGVGCE